MKNRIFSRTEASTTEPERIPPGHREVRHAEGGQNSCTVFYATLLRIPHNDGHPAGRHNRQGFHVQVTAPPCG